MISSQVERISVSSPRSTLRRDSLVLFSFFRQKGFRSHAPSASARQRLHTPNLAPGPVRHFSTPRTCATTNALRNEIPHTTRTPFDTFRHPHAHSLNTLRNEIPSRPTGPVRHFSTLHAQQNQRPAKRNPPHAHQPRSTLFDTPRPTESTPCETKSPRPPATPSTLFDTHRHPPRRLNRLTVSASRSVPPESASRRLSTCVESLRNRPASSTKPAATRPKYFLRTSLFPPHHFGNYR